jgi:hypothetical protein
MLLYSNILCVSRYIDQEANHGNQANREEEEEEEEGPTAWPVVPPSKAGTTAQIPPITGEKRRDDIHADTTAPSDRYYRPPVLPPNFRPTSGNALNARRTSQEVKEPFSELDRK